MQKEIKASLQELKALYQTNNFDQLIALYEPLIIQIENDLFAQSSSLYFLQDLFDLLSIDDRPSGNYKDKINNYLLYTNDLGLSLYEDLVYLFKIHFLEAKQDKHNQSDILMFMHYVYMQIKYLLFKKIRKANQIVVRNLDSYITSDYNSIDSKYYLFEFVDKKNLDVIYSNTYYTYLFNLIIENPSLHKRAKILNIAPATLKKREEPIWQSLRKML